MIAKHALMCRWILFTNNYKLLTPWEVRFLETIFSDRWRLTIKQISKLDEIYNQLRFTERCKFTRSESASSANVALMQYDTTIGDYAYIHDFDK